MIFGSVCSGIEAASVAWQPLGWRAAFLAEIEAFPNAVLRHHYPEVPNRGDITRFKEWPDAALDVLVGGTPCQSFSVAGLRKGLADPRGNLALVYLALLERFRPAWMVWENVPGILSTDNGRAFGAFLGGLGQLGYGWAYRVLDAQHVRVDGLERAVPQRRRRVFVVGHSGGDWRRAAAVLFERQSLFWDHPPRRETGQGIADSLEASLGRRCGQPNEGNRKGHLIAASLNGNSGRRQVEETYLAYGGNNRSGAIDVASALNGHPGPHGRLDFTVETFIAFDTTQITHPENRCKPEPGDHCHPLAAEGHPPAIAVADPISANESRTYTHEGANNFRLHNVVPQGWAVRRLTPTECERLQGFPDGYTAIPYRGCIAADGPRYKALGNAMAVNVVRWIGTRIQMVEDALKEVSP